MKRALSDYERLLLRSTAVILENDDGTPRRRIDIGHQHKPVGDYPSAKCRGTFTREAREERALFILSEVDSNVLSFLSQPHELRFVFDGIQYSYFPDLRRDIVGGKVQIIEVKKTSKEVERDPWYELKLFLAEDIYNGLPGWSFEIYDKRKIYFPEAVWENSLRIHQRGRLAIPESAKYDVVGHLIAKGGHSRLGVLVEMLGGWAKGRALLEAMHVHRIVSIDIRLPVCPGTRVDLLNPEEAA